MKCLFENYYIIIITFCHILKERDPLLRLKRKLFCHYNNNNKLVPVHTMKAHNAVDM